MRPSLTDCHPAMHALLLVICTHATDSIPEDSFDIDRSIEMEKNSVFANTQAGAFELWSWVGLGIFVVCAAICNNLEVMCVQKRE